MLSTRLGENDWLAKPSLVWNVIVFVSFAMLMLSSCIVICGEKPNIWYVEKKSEVSSFIVCLSSVSGVSVSFSMVVGVVNCAVLWEESVNNRMKVISCQYFVRVIIIYNL